MNKEISLEELEGFYLEALELADRNIEKENNEFIADILFEDFDSSTVFLHKNTLNKLKDGKIINEEILNLSLELRDKSVNLLSRVDERLPAFVASSEWIEVYNLASQIRKLKQKFDKSKR